MRLLKARIVPGTLGANPEDGVRPKGVIHWVSARHALPVEFRLYGRLFRTKDPEEGGLPAKPQPRGPCGEAGLH